MSSPRLTAAALDLADATPVASPCINICRMHPQSGLCEGCLRTLDEIAMWSQLGDAAKRAVWVDIDGRRAAQQLGTQGLASGSAR